jgi:hypothetical protein
MGGGGLFNFGEFLKVTKVKIPNINMIQIAKFGIRSMLSESCIAKFNIHKLPVNMV